jgi:hypothetical protein
MKMADTNEDANISPDDALEPADPAIEDFVNQQSLPQDSDRPAAPADDVPNANSVEPDSQLFDADEDSDEAYQEGADASTGLPPKSAEDI